MSRPSDVSDRARAIQFLTIAKRWVASRELAEFIERPLNATCASLATSVAAGVVQKRVQLGGNGGSTTYWRIAQEPSECKSFQIPGWPPGFVSKFNQPEGCT